MLDVGVGAGRTVPALSSRAGRYVGVDYSQHMIDRAHELHPAADLRVMDAAELDFADGEFDAVVFSFNGLDYLHPREKRARGIAELARVTRAGGVVILSEHNARALVRPVGRLRDPTQPPAGAPRPAVLVVQACSAGVPLAGVLARRRVSRRTPQPSS